MRLSEHDKEVLLEALYTAPPRDPSRDFERTQLALKVQASSGETLDEMNASVERQKNDVFIATIEALQGLVFRLTEEVGKFILFLEVLTAEQPEAAVEVERARASLLEVKRADAKIRTALRDLRRL